MALSRLRVPEGLADNRAQSQASVKALLGFYETLWQLGTMQSELSGYESQVAAFQHMVYPSESAITSATLLAQRNPGLGMPDLVSRIYPVQYAVLDAETRETLEAVVPQAGAVEGPPGDPIAWQCVYILFLRLLFPSPKCGVPCFGLGLFLFWGF